MKSFTALAIVLVLVQIALVHSLTCPTNTRLFGNMCYSYQSQFKEWGEANKVCKLSGGQLATIGSFAVNDFLFKTYRQTRSKHIWVGLERCYNKWCYPDGKTSIFLKWNNGEPNNSGGNEDCVEMWGNGRWNDAPCFIKKPFFCEIQAEVDECFLGTHNCHSQATCNNTIGSYTCTCKSGFAGNGRLCKDVDECSDIFNDCSFNAVCKNTFGGYTCLCLSGYAGDGKTCTKVSDAHNKILQELQNHEKATDKKLTKIESMLQKLLGSSNSARPKKTTANGGI